MPLRPHSLHNMNKHEVKEPVGHWWESCDMQTLSVVQPIKGRVKAEGGTDNGKHTGQPALNLNTLSLGGFEVWHALRVDKAKLKTALYGDMVDWT